MEKDKLSAQQFTGSQIGSLRDQPVSTLVTAIRSPSDHGKILKRTNSVLSLYFDPDLDAETKAELRQEFVVALQDYPDWATQRAFDQWVKDAKRRPSPGEIAALASQQLQTIRDEMEWRRNDEARRAPPMPPAEPHRLTDEQRYQAEKALAQSGFTTERMAMVKRFPMAKTIDEAKAKMADFNTPTPHWSETAAPDDPRWEILRKSRAASSVVPMIVPQEAAE